ncbi:hypothetical protein FJ425_21270 [Mesorhizobium sp. B2-7-2]|nr:hypothetical protein FJ425_21270 [Mesorhizobium sp. B2-7-2]
MNRNPAAARLFLGRGTMDSRTVSTSARAVASSRNVTWHRTASLRDLLRAALLASTALTVAAYLAPAQAQDATWLASPADGNYNNDANWSSGTAPDGTATFDASSVTSLTISVNTTLGGWTFDPGGPDYDFSNGSVLAFNGAGIVANGGSVAIANHGGLYFYGNSSAGSAAITNSGYLAFYDNSTAGGATITNTSILDFNNASTAGNAVITNNSNLYFYDNSAAGSAAITNNGNLFFYGTSTAGNAAVTNDNYLSFNNASTAGNAAITNASYSRLYFYDTSTAGNAAIINNYDLTFWDASTAGNAAITNASNGYLYFYNTSTAGNAAVTNNSGGNVDFSYSTGPNGDHKLSAGSIAGPGSYILGANELTVGSNDLSTEVSGEISGAGGSLVKVGTGTLTLSGSNTYTGGTAINGGTLQLGNAGSVGTIMGAITLGSGGRFDVVNADTSGIASLTNAGGIVNIGDDNMLAGTISNTGAGQINLGARATLYDTGSVLNNDATINVGTDGIVMSNGDINNNAGGVINFNGAGGTAQLSPVSSVYNSGQINVIGGDVRLGLSYFNNQSGGSVSLIGGDMSWVNDFTNSAGATLTVGAGRTLDVQYFDFYGGTATGAGTIKSSSGIYIWGPGTIGTTLAGTASLAKGGPGTTVLTGAHTYTGGTTINAGTLQLGDSNTAGAILGAVNVAGYSGTFDVVNADTNGITSITNSGTTNFRNGTSAGSAVITNNGNLYFYDNSTAGSATVANTGDLSFSDDSTAGSATIANNGNLYFWDTSTGGSATIANNGNLSFHGSSTAGNATITNSSSMIFVDSSTAGNATIINNDGLSFGGSSTAGGAVITTNAVLSFFDNGTAGDAAITNNAGVYFYNSSTAGNATIANNYGLYFLDASTAGNAAITNGNSSSEVDFSTSTGPNGDGKLSAGSIAGPGSYILGANELTVGSNDRSTEVNGVISGTGGSLVKTGTGTLTLSGANTYNGGTTINGGILQLGNGGGTGSILGDVVNNGVLAFNRSDVAIFSGVISGSGAVRQIGGGTTILTGDNTYTGGTTIAGGTLQIGNGGGTGSILGNVVNDGVLTFNRTGTLTLAGDISGSGAVRQIGLGTTVLTGTNSYSGDTLVTDGRLQFGGSGNTLGGNLIVAGGTLAIQTPATVSVAQAVIFGDNTALSIVAGANGPALSANSVTIGNDVALNISGIDDASQLDKVLINTTSGISGDFDTVTVGGFSGTVDYLTVSTRKSANNLQYLASYGLSWTANNSLAHGTFTLTNPSDSFTVGAVLADQTANPVTGWNGAALTKAGLGTLVLTAANTYTGGTTIADGTLQLGDSTTAGSILGAVTVGSSGTFDVVNADTGGITGITNAGTTNFRNGTSAGSAAIVNSGLLTFNDDSTAGNATVTNYGSLYFYNTSTGGNAGITNASNGHLAFFDTSTAGNATIANSGALYFQGNSTAGSAAITNNGAMALYDSSTAGSADITNYGYLTFYDTSTAGNAGITNASNGYLAFYDTGTAGSAAITNNGGLYFYGTSTAGSAAITNTSNGSLAFNGSSTAGSAAITNNGGLYFYGTSTAGSATITNNSALYFRDASTAGNAVITNNGYLAFNDSGTAGNAAITNDQGGTVDFSGTTGPNGDYKLSAGSIAGAGDYILGSNELTVGSNGFSTEVSGVIAGAGGALVKIGTGTLTLSGANNSVGAVTVSNGTLALSQTGTFSATTYTTQGGAVTAIGGAAQLAVTGAFTQDAGSTLNVTLGANQPIITADSASLGGTLNIAGLAASTSTASALAGTQFTVIATTNGISGDFANVIIGGASNPVDYLTAMGRKSADNLAYNVGLGLTWTAGAARGNGAFTLANGTDAFNVDMALTNQAGPFASGWDGTSLTKNGDGTLTLSAMNAYTGSTTINGGTLAITAAGGITSDVTNNATFRNAGTVTGGVTNNAGATFTQTAGHVSNGVINSGTVNANGALNGAIANNAGGIFTIGGTLTGDSTFSNANGATLAVAATGDYTLAGLLTNSGGVTIAAGGSLTAPAGILNKAGGAITNNGTVADALDNAGLVTNNGVYNANVASNTGTISNTAGGIWNGNFNTAGVVNNDGTINGSLTQTAGTTANNGTITGAVAVSGGLFTGSGSVGGLTIASGATVAPGVAGGIGTMSVAGNVTFDAGSIYQVTVNTAGQASHINATGSIAINGGSVNVLAGSGNYAPSTTYIILSTTTNGGRTGTFDSVSSNLAFLTSTLGYGASDVTLTMTRNNVDFAAIGITADQITTGGGIESLGFGNPLYNAVLNLSAPQAQYAFDQLSGEIHASAKTALIEDSRFVRSAVNDRIRAAFDAVGASGTVTTYVDGKPVTVKANTDRLAVWGQGFGSWGHTHGDGNAATLNRKTGGFFVGADAPVFDTWRFGAVAGYSRTDFNVKDGHSSGTSDTYHLGLYGGTAWGDLAFRTGAAYTWHDVSTNRSVIFPGFGDSLKGKYNAATAQVFGELAYGFNAGGARFEPFANLAYMNLHTDGFTERGGAAALTSAAANTDATFTTLGLRASTTFDLGGTTLTANGMLGWRHAFGDVTPLSTMRFASGGDAFSIGGVPITRDAAVIEAGISYAITPNATFGISYGGQFGSRMSDQSARANFNVRF